MRKRLSNRFDFFFLLLLCTDAVFIFLTWLLRPDAVHSVSLFALLFSALTLALCLWLEHRRRRRISAALEALLERPEEVGKAALIAAAGEAWSESVELLYEKLISEQADLRQKQSELLAYREYIEAWVHEIKTPLSLSALVLNNRKDEMSPYVYERMSHVEHSLNENAERILYYARLQADHVEYKFAEFRLDECVRDVLSEYAGLAEENGIVLTADLRPLSVISDRRIVRFMLCQLIGNAYKYADRQTPSVRISLCQQDDKIHLSLYNNGDGVPPEDEPFLLDKGFTGNHPDRQKATGMGLYLVQKYAQALCVELRLHPNPPAPNDSFGIEMIFAL